MCRIEIEGLLAMCVFMYTIHIQYRLGHKHAQKQSCKHAHTGNNSVLFWVYTHARWPSVKSGPKQCIKTWWINCRCLWNCKMFGIPPLNNSHQGQRFAHTNNLRTSSSQNKHIRHGPSDQNDPMCLHLLRALVHTDLDDDNASCHKTK